MTFAVAVFDLGQFLFEPGPLLFLMLDGVQQAGVVDDAADLKGDRAQGADLILAEAARLAGLDDDHADGGLVLEQRQPQKGEELFLPGFLEILVAGMRRGVVGHDHVAAFDNQAGETFVDLHGNPVNRCL